MPGMVGGCHTLIICLPGASAYGGNPLFEPQGVGGIFFDSLDSGDLTAQVVNPRLPAVGVIHAGEAQPGVEIHSLFLYGHLEISSGQLEKGAFPGFRLHPQEQTLQTRVSDFCS